MSEHTKIIFIGVALALSIGVILYDEEAAKKEVNITASEKLKLFTSGNISDIKKYNLMEEYNQYLFKTKTPNMMLFGLN